MNWDVLVWILVGMWIHYALTGAVGYFPEVRFSKGYSAGHSKDGLKPPPASISRFKADPELVTNLEGDQKSKQAAQEYIRERNGSQAER